MRRVRSVAALMLLCALLPGCSDEGASSSSSAHQGSNSLATAPAGQTKSAAPANSGPDQKYRAIHHEFELRLPSESVEAVATRHRELCAKSACTILIARLDRSDKERVSANLSLRMSPEAFEAFNTVLTGPNSAVTSHKETAEDLTLSVIEVEKRLAIKRALRDRLEALLKDQPNARLSDVMDIQRQLFQVQEEIETATSQQAYLLTRTDSIKVDLTYWGYAPPTETSNLSIIEEALHGVRRTAARSVASLISFLALVLPWSPLAIAALWGFGRWRRKRVKTSPKTAASVQQDK